MNKEAGKGDKRRPTNELVYQTNYDKIFNKQQEAVVKVQQLEKERLCSKDTTKIVLDKE